MMMCVIMVVCFMPTVAMAAEDDEINTAERLTQAIQNASENDVINLSGDIGLTSQLNINKPVTINGNNHTITSNISQGTSGESAAGILITANANLKNLKVIGPNQNNPISWKSGFITVKVYGGEVTLDNVEFTRGSEALQVSGSGTKVTISGTQNYNGNVYNGIEVKEEATLIIGENTAFSNKNNSVVWINDGESGKVIDTNNVLDVISDKNSGNDSQYGYAVAKVDNEKFGSLTNAINAATGGQTVTLLGDVKLSTKITIDENITIDGNGHTITADAEINDHLLLITADATVKNVKLDSAKKAKGVHVYSQNTPVSASFDGVTFANSKGSGLTVNGTTVSLKDVAFTESAWQDVNVDSGVGVDNNSVLNIGTGCKFAHELQITSDGQKDGSTGKYGGKYGTVTLNDSAKTLAEKTIDVTAKDISNADYTYQKKVWTISDKPYIPPYIPPTTPTDNVTNSGSTGTDNATTSADLSGSTSTSNGTTSATVDKTTADKIVDKAVENKSTEVVIDATANTTTAANSTTIAQVTIPTETLGAIAEKTEADVTIKTDVAEVKMDNAAAAAVSEQAEGDTVQIIAEKVKEDATEVHFELKVVCSDGKVISDFKGGNVAVTVALPKAMADKKVVCVYIDDNGHMSKVAGQKNADGTYTFNTGHFSSYAIMAEEEA
ncbi:MAG: pectate lyase-like adhesive domain-containing protein, partial [Anaerovoracaceae bacterium]